ncbi:uncharacterized protein LOC131317570 [Rhododendron vialii]|uniref:uncharacterized protein LOC131317570 n=1 Tax=Rhododendron vialii TaxID=182163 RepID=UPI00265E8A59|nr:uncharacterized protein LOC131317570 [Rhododendron vialii]
MSILINGSATSECHNQKGLRQGDPLSPFLFNIVVEALNILLVRARELNIIKGTKIGANGVILSHLQFADDTILFCNNDGAEMANIKRILRYFQLMSGLKINFSESSLCGVRICHLDVSNLARVMGCKVETLPIKYLGLPLGNASSGTGSIIQAGFKVQVGSGQETLLWDHIWLGEVALKDVYLRLFRISTQKDQVISVVKEGAGEGSWNLHFGRRLYDWEELQKVELQQRLQNVALDYSKKDTLQWIWSSNKCFSVKSNLSPPKVEIFSWLAVQGRVATRSLLMSKNVIQEGPLSKCPFCVTFEETPEHLFLHYQFSWNTWSLILRWWQMLWVCPPSLVDLTNWWFDNRFKSLERHIWEVTFFATLWSLWLARNDLVFNNVLRSACEVGDQIKTRVAMWMKAKFVIKVYSVEDFKCFLGGIRKLKL